MERKGPFASSCAVWMDLCADKSPPTNDYIWPNVANAKADIESTYKHLRSMPYYGKQMALRRTAT